MGWLPVVGSLKLNVFFAKEPYERDDSAKETYNFKEPTNRRRAICVALSGLRATIHIAGIRPALSS